MDDIDMPFANIQVSLVLPCYNESEHIAVSLPKINKILEFCLGKENYEIICVDDASTDHTLAWLNQHRDANLKVLGNKTNLGRGETVKVGLRAARFPISGFMDIDCEVAETYLPKFILTMSEGADFVVARRIYRLSPHPYILIRHFLSIVYRIVLNYFLRIKILDTESGYKFFSPVARDIILEKSFFTGWFWDTEVCAVIEMSDLRAVEIPAVYTRNPNKTSTVKVTRDSGRYMQSLLHFLRLRRQGHYNNIVKRNG